MRKKTLQTIVFSWYKEKDISFQLKSKLFLGFEVGKNRYREQYMKRMDLNCNQTNNSVTA